MQTFLPYRSFKESARCLDNKRLGKQRVESLQILKCLTSTEKNGWSNHPAVRMWRGYEGSLVNYALIICEEWSKRGFRDTCAVKIFDLATIRLGHYLDGGLPLWLGDDNFHASHRSNLLRKNFTHYSQFGWTEPTDLPYVWPL